MKSALQIRAPNTDYIHNARLHQGYFDNDRATFQQYALVPAEIVAKVRKAPPSISSRTQIADHVTAPAKSEF